MDFKSLFLLAVLAVSAIEHSGAAPMIEKLGVYEYFVDESTPVTFNGNFLMFESIVQSSPQWAGHWLPSFANCSCYYRIRDIVRGEVVVNISETCNHAFGSALVTSGTGSNSDTLFVFGTPWIRTNTPISRMPQAADSKVKSQWSGPCSVGNCSVNVFWSSDPALQSWLSGPGAPLTKGLTVYNNDVTAVIADPSAQILLGLPPHRWVMAIETGAERTTFLVSNGSSTSPHSPATGWVALDPTQYIVPRFTADIGSCPSVRYVAATGYYYVLTGGSSVYITRSKNLHDWQLGQPAVLAPSLDDCSVAPPYFGHYIPNAQEEALIHSCTARGFGDDSDIDLMEWTDPRTNTTTVLLQYGSGNQATFGFSNLALFNGTLSTFLESFF